MRRIFGSFRMRCKLSWSSVAAEGVSVVNCTKIPLSQWSYELDALALCWKRYCSASFQHPFIDQGETFPRGTSSDEVLLRRFDVALKGDNLEEAWEAIHKHRKLHGLPRRRVLSSLITLLSYASNHRWLGVAYGIVLTVHQENRGLLCSSTLTKLGLRFARHQDPVHASTMLRIALECGRIPPVNVLNAMFLHMSKSSDGSYLASEMMVEIYDLVLRQVLKRRKCRATEHLKCSINLFNVVLDSCAKYKYTIKAQMLLELMSQVGVVADANTIVIFSKLYAIIGRRDELMELESCVKSIVSVASPALIRLYQHFYHNILSLHFMYNDVDAASQLMLHLYREVKVKCTSYNEPTKQFILQIGSANLKSGYKIVFDPIRLDSGFVTDVPSQGNLVHLTDGRLTPSDKAIAKLILGCLKVRDVRKISDFLVTLSKEDLVDMSLQIDVIHSCIGNCWLVAAHDMIDDMASAGFPVGVDTYLMLSRAYKRINQLEECNNVLRTVKKIYAGAYSVCPSGVDDYKLETTEASFTKGPQLTDILVEEAREDSLDNQLFYELSSSIYFFCQSKMMDDARRALKCMREKKIQPTSQLLSHLIFGYFSLHMDREITVLWGEIRRELDDGVILLNRELLDCALESFLRGGYFGRVMEVIGYMMRNKMYCDQWKYKRMFLSLHKNLYRKLTASDVRIGPQQTRIEDVDDFRAWAGIQ